VLGSRGALLVDLLPTSHTRLGDASGVRELPEAAVEDAMAAGVAAQMRAFAAAVRGEVVEVPDAVASIRSSEVGQAVIAAARSRRRVDV
jgi:predicted dehydrogenase